MSDAKVRAGERRARCGDHEAAARTYRERIRAGQLEEWRLWVGASLSDPACLIACSLEPDHREELADLFDVLRIHAPAGTVLRWLVRAVRIWSDAEQRSPGVAGSVEVRDLLDYIESALVPNALTFLIPARVYRLAANVEAFSAVRPIGFALAELVIAWGNGTPPPHGSNPAAVGVWLDNGGGIRDLTNWTMLAPRIRHALRRAMLPALLQ